MDDETRVFVKKQIIGFVVMVACVAAFQVIHDLQDEDSQTNYKIRWHLSRLRKRMTRDQEIKREAEEGIVATESWLQRIGKRERS